MKWKTVMDDSYPHDDDSIPPLPWNCRCALLGIEVPWIIEIEWIMDEVFGDTEPRLPEFDE